ncbi:MAG: transposase [Opitutaceae bacterium]
MARKLRLEFPGACYNVIYRGDVFRTDGAKAAFERCLFEGCRKSGWVLHAFVIMRNHYHLAVETPQGAAKRGHVVIVDRSASDWDAWGRPKGVMS